MIPIMRGESHRHRWFTATLGVLFLVVACSDDGSEIPQGDGSAPSSPDAAPPPESDTGPASLDGGKPTDAGRSDAAAACTGASCDASAPDATDSSVSTQLDAAHDNPETGSSSHGDAGHGDAGHGDAGHEDAALVDSAPPPFAETRSVQCGATECATPNLCCRSILGTSRCISEGESCAGAVLACDDAEDCASGNVCCWQGAGSFCAASCPVEQLCSRTASDECLTGSCGALGVTRTEPNDSAGLCTGVRRPIELPVPAREGDCVKHEPLPPEGAKLTHARGELWAYTFNPRTLYRQRGGRWFSVTPPTSSFQEVLVSEQDLFVITRGGGNSVFQAERFTEFGWQRVDDAQFNIATIQDVAAAVGKLYILELFEQVKIWSEGEWSTLPALCAAPPCTQRGLPTAVRATAADVFVAYQGAILRLAGTTWETLPQTGASEFDSLAVSTDGHVFATSNGEVWSMAAGEMSPLAVPQCAHARSTTAHGKYVHLRCDQDTELVWNGQTFVTLPKVPQASGEPDPPVVSPFGEVFASRPFLRLADGSWAVESSAQPFGSVLFGDVTDTVFVGGEDGVHRLTESGLVPVPETAHWNVKSAHKTPDGTLVAVATLVDTAPRKPCSNDDDCDPNWQCTTEAATLDQPECFPAPVVFMNTGAGWEQETLRVAEPDKYVSPIASTPEDVYLAVGCFVYHYRGGSWSERQLPESECTPFRNRGDQSQITGVATTGERLLVGVRGDFERIVEYSEGAWQPARIRQRSTATHPHFFTQVGSPAAPTVFTLLDSVSWRVDNAGWVAAPSPPAHATGTDLNSLVACDTEYRSYQEATPGEILFLRPSFFAPCGRHLLANSSRLVTLTPGESLIECTNNR